MESFDPQRSSVSKASRSTREYRALLLTINTNKVFSDISAQDLEKFKKWFFWFIGKNNVQRFIDNFVVHMKQIGPSKYDANDKEYTSNHIISYDVDSKMEISDDDKLHNHTVISITANKKPGYGLMIDTDKIRTLFLRAFGYLAYVHADPAHDSARAMREYVYKNKTK